MRQLPVKLFLAAACLILGGALATPVYAEIQMDPDVPPAVQAQLNQDLELVAGIKGSATSGLYEKIFNDRALDGSTLIKFFNGRVMRLGLDDCGGGPSVAACVKPGLDSQKMWFTPNYVTASIPQIFRISVVFHESRHTEDENDNWMHATCPTPYLDENGKDIVGIVSGTKMEGHDACDITPFGSYGLQAVFLKNIEKACTNCSAKIKMDAKLYGDDTLLRISDLEFRKNMRDDLN